MNLNDRVKRLERKNKAKIIADVSITILMVIVIVYLIVIGVKSFFPEKEKVITFNVIGIVNNTNATTLTQLHLECIKYCVNELSEGYESQYKCYEQCSSLGKER